jgi:hypothetical protein
MWHGSGIAGEGMESVRFVRWKPPAIVTIDDRAIPFFGHWPAREAIEGFRPWNKK